MIDFVKICVFRFDLAKIRSNPLLEDQFTELNTVSGETFEDKLNRLEYRGLKIRILYMKKMVISGSLHKYFTFDSELGKGHNHGDFTLANLKRTIKDLGAIFYFNPYDAKLENVEFGVNLRPKSNCADFHQHLVSHKNKSFSDFRTKNSGLLGKACSHYQYEVKIYNKGKLCKLSHSEIRVEVKVRRMEYLDEILRPAFGFQENQILRLSDLMNKEILTFLRNRLLRVSGEILFHYELPNNNLSLKEQLFVAIYSNPLTWENIDLGKDFKRNKKEKYHKLVKRYRNHLINDHLASRIEEKFDELLNNSSEEIEAKPSYPCNDYLVTLYDRSDSKGLSVSREIISIPFQHPL